jgi:hypothetical protein
MRAGRFCTGWSSFTQISNAGTRPRRGTHAHLTPSLVAQLIRDKARSEKTIDALAQSRMTYLGASVAATVRRCDSKLERNIIMRSSTCAFPQNCSACNYRSCADNSHRSGVVAGKMTAPGPGLQTTYTPEGGSAYANSDMVVPSIIRCGTTDADRFSGAGFAASPGL